IHPTLNDAFPLVILEAMQHRLPVISTYEGAIPEIVDDLTTGFLVVKNDVEALVGKIEVLLDNETIRKEMGLAGQRKFLTNYTVEKMEENITKVLHEILIPIDGNIQS
ncbi:MAG: glycosyltransferase family 4 protein, partial [Cyclobacteriaceae bacterium]|nr:glycosyltransferase family 4 protein [Cyclobacteriaceae bacterium]